MTVSQKTALMKRWRGVVLELVYDGWRQQESRLDDLTLWGLMRDLSHDVSRNDVITVLQQLETRQYLRFRQKNNEYSGQTHISEIELTSGGSDVVEKITSDSAILLL